MSDKKITTDSGIEIKQIYTEPSDMNEKPGEYPYTRGVHPGMYRSRLWTMRQYAGFSTAEESNKRYHYLLRIRNLRLINSVSKIIELFEKTPQNLEHMEDHLEKMKLYIF